MALRLPLDTKLTAAIKRRRIAEEERKARIFNSKQRTMGVDVDGLNHQVHHSKLLQQQEADKEKAFAEQYLRCNRLAISLQKQQEEEIRNILKDMNEFRLNDQKAEDRREFDLYDRDRLKKELPARISDDDPRCSLSGLQKLEGEDLDYKNRTKKQKEQYSESLIEQMRAKRLELDRRNTDLHNLELKLRQLDRHSCQLALYEENCQRQTAAENAAFNQNLARQQKEFQQHQEMLEDLDKQQDIYNNFYGDMLSENPDVARSSFGPNRVVPDRWKGMTKKQLINYHKDREDQIIESKRNRERQQQDQAEWERLVLSQERNAILMQRCRDREVKRLNQEQMIENNELAQIQKQHKDYLEKVVYSNVPTDKFYEQFNTTTR